MADKSILYYGLNDYVFLGYQVNTTGNNIIILANSIGVVDKGQVIINHRQATYGVIIGADAKLTIGGAYQGEKPEKNRYNIFVNSTISGNSPINPEGETYSDTTGAVLFENNGTLVLASQSGNVKANVDYYIRKLEKSDENLHIKALHSVTTSSDKWVISNNSVTVNGALPTVFKVRTFMAGGTLTVNGSLTGIIDAELYISLGGGKVIDSEGKVTYSNSVSGNPVNASVFKAAAVEITGNVAGALTAQIYGSMTGAASIATDSNDVSARVFETDSFTMKNGIFAGNSTASVHDLTANAEMAKGDKASFSGNQIIANVVKADSININQIGSSALVSGGTLSAELKNISLKAKSDGTPDGESSEAKNISTNVDDNTLEAVTIDGATVNLASLNKDAKILADVADVVLAASRGDTYKAPYVESMKSNTVNSIALRASALNIGDMYGTFEANASGVNLSRQQPDWSDCGNRLMVIGISADTLNVLGVMAGSISVNASDLYVADGATAVMGIKSSYITVAGRIDSNITVNSDSFMLSDSNIGINVGTMVADAFSGTLTVTGSENVGMQASKTIRSEVNGDSFDINGSITSTYFGVASREVINLRVSGKISSAIAISAEHLFSNRTADGIVHSTYNDTPQDDTVELAATAEVTGDINLYRGKNTLIINSMAKFDGSMLATGGVLNVKFILEGVQDRAIVKDAGSGDVTLSSGNTIIIDLNYAKNGETYKLISYADSGAKKFWLGDGAEHLVEFLYRGETRYLKVEGDGETYITLGDVTAHLYYDEASNSVIVDEISGIEELEKFTGIDEEKTWYDEEKRMVTVSWNREDLSDLDKVYAYELEYTVYRGGVKCGESVSVRMTDSKVSSYDIRGIDADQTVKVRMRAIGDAEAANTTGWSEEFEVAGEDTGVVELDMKGKKTTVIDAINSSKTLGGPAALFSWEAANSTNAIANYTLEVYETNDKIVLTQEEKDAGITFEEKVVDTIAKARLQGDTYIKTVSNTEAVVSGMQHLAYVYWRVQGTDVEGNVTEWRNESLHTVNWLSGISGDSTPPEFVTVKGRKQVTMYMEEDRSLAGQVKYNLLFQWNKAEDAGIGMKCYEIEYTLTTDANWEKSTKIQVLADDAELDDPDYQYSYALYGLEGGEYMYRISALDYANNQSNYIGNEVFGSSDVTPPTGTFIRMGEPEIEAEYWYEIIGGTTSGGTVSGGTTSGGTISGGTTSGGTTSGGTSTYEIVRYLENATVTFDWEDNYTDEAGVYYKIQFSDSETFASSKTYTYTTNVADEKSFTIDNSKPTMPVGIFAGMSTVYWRVMAIDGNRNETGVYSNTRSFKFVNEWGEAIKHEEAPDQPFDLTVSTPKVDGVGSGDVIISWCNYHTDLGILYYVVECKSKDGGDNFKIRYDSATDKNAGEEGDVSELEGHLVNPNTYAAIADGTYTWTVYAYNAIGRASKTSGEKFVQDTVRPTKAEDLEADVMVSDVSLSWTESYDQFKIASYEVKYRLVGTEYWSKLTSTKNSAMLFGMTDGVYEYCVNAYDKNGNVSLDSDIVQFTVSRGTDLCDYYYPMEWVSYEAAAGASGLGQTVGINDKADYFYIARSGKFSLTVNLTDLEQVYGKKSSLKLELCKYDGSGTEKAIKSVSLSGKKYGVINGMMMDAGEIGSVYYFKLTSSVSTSSVKYLLDVVTDDYSKANQEFDDTAAEADVLATRTEDPSFVSMTEAVTGEWVGYGDTIDYRKIELTVDGSYDFTLSNIDGATQLTLTVWQLNDKGKLKSVKSCKVQGCDAGGLIKLLMFKDNTYYVSVEAKNGKKGECSNYDLTMSGQEFNQNNNADDNWMTLDEELYTVKYGDVVENEWVGYNDTIDYRKIALGNSGSYNFFVTGVDPEVAVTLTVWQDKGKNKLTSVKKVTTKTGEAAAAISALLLDAANSYYVSVESKNAKKGDSTNYNLLFGGVKFTKVNNADDNWDELPQGYVLGAGEKITGEWVGYGDTIDYRELKVAVSDNYTFTLLKDMPNASLTLTIWEDKGTGKSKSKLSSVKKVTTAKNSFQLELANIALDANKTYYISVEAKNAKKGEYSGYSLAMSGDFKPVANNADDTAELARGVNRFANSNSLLDWVGTGDTEDWFELNVNTAQEFELDFNMRDNADVALFEADGKTQVAFLGSSVGLEAGTYFLQIKMEEPIETGVVYEVGFDKDEAKITAVAKLA